MIRTWVAALFLPVYMAATGASAVTLSLQPSSQTAAPGDAISLELVVGGLGDLSAPSLGAFDVNLLFDSSKFSLTGFSLSAMLGDVALGEALDLSLGNSGSGIVNIAELSLLDADATSGPSFVGPYLDDIQTDSFILATLNFLVDSLLPGASTSVFIDTAAVVLGDGFGDGLGLESASNAVISNPGGAAPEPATLALLAFGIAGIGYQRRRRRV